MFTQTTAEIPPRAQRLRDELATAIARSNRAVAEVARAYDVGWGTAHWALVAAAARWLPAPTRVLGIDETRARRVPVGDLCERLARRTEPGPPGRGRDRGHRPVRTVRVRHPQNSAEAVDKWHLIKLANDAVTQVRQRLTQQLHGRCGRKTDPVWAHRQMFLTGAERLSRKQSAA